MPRGLHICRFICHELKLQVQPRLTGPVKVVHHHVEGWQAVQRMWRYSFTEWQGAQGYELQIPLIFDGWPYNPATGQAMNSVERQVGRFEKLCEKLPNVPRTPIFSIDGGGRVPHDYTNDHTKLWVISAMEWGDDYITNDAGQRCRQAFTATVWEWVPDKVVQSNNRYPTKPVPKTYRIRRGDTLVKIAVNFYGDGSRWRDIQKLNHLRDPNHPKVGKVIKLPAR